MGLFSSKPDAPAVLRPGSLTPDEVHNRIYSIGVGNIVEIIRIGFDGDLDDIPIIVEITDITPEGFSGRIVNVERELIEKNSVKKIYAKRGGGTITFQFTDGDIKEIIVNQDLEELAEARDISGIVAVLEALEENDRILVAYYDKKHRGTVNIEGTLLSKSPLNKNFTIILDKINNIELDTKQRKQLNIENDMVIDISLV